MLQSLGIEPMHLAWGVRLAANCQVIQLLIDIDMTFFDVDTYFVSFGRLC